MRSASTPLGRQIGKAGFPEGLGRSRGVSVALQEVGQHEQGVGGNRSLSLQTLSNGLCRMICRGAIKTGQPCAIKTGIIRWGYCQSGEVL